MGKLSAKIAVISGGTGGLGQALTTRFLQEGMTVFVIHSGSVSSERFIRTLSQSFKNVDHAAVDVTSERAVQQCFELLEQKYGGIDILCNLAGGVGPKANLEDISSLEWSRMFSLNLNSCFLMMREALRVMKRRQWGRIINIGAMPALMAEGQRGGYAAAKAGVLALTKGVSEELKDFRDITINAIVPSIILTEENKQWGSEQDFERWVTPEQIAQMIAFLCTDESNAMNGQIIQMYGKV